MNVDWLIWNLQGLGAVVGALSRNLHDLQDRQGSYLSIYDQPTLPLQVSLAFSLVQQSLTLIVMFFPNALRQAAG